MHNLWIVTKNELYRYFVSPLAYVYLMTFLLLNGSFAIYFGHFFERGEASLLSMFIWQPWLYLLFIPGISMRLWAEEFRSKTIIQIMTMPVSLTALVWGKFFASWLFAGLALLLTFPFWITVNILGTPDNTVIAVSYLGSWILAGCMLAISQTMSALTKNQVIALVFSVIANLLFLLSGLEYVLSFFRLFAPLSLVDMIASFSFISHFESLTLGLLELRDIVYFLSLILLFNVTTAMIISFRTAGTTRFLQTASRRYYILTFLLLLTAFIGLNLTANNFLRSFRHDFSADKSFTLGASTKKLLSQLPETVTAKLYYSKELEQRDPQFRNAFDKVRLLLRQYADNSDGKFIFRIYYPQTLDEAEDRALASGLQALPLIDASRAAYFGLVLSDSLDNQQIIPFFPLERINALEADITSRLYLLSHQKKTLGIFSTLPVFGHIGNNYAIEKWEIIRKLEDYYKIIPLDNKAFPSDLDLVMLIQPRNLSPELKNSLQQYTDKGGKILAFLDIAAEAPLLSSPAIDEYKAADLAGLEKNWGFKFFPDVAVADLGNSLTIDASTNYGVNTRFTQDIMQFLLKHSDFSKLPETQNLHRLLFASASMLEPDPQSDADFYPLVQAGNLSALVSANAVRQSVSPVQLLRDFKPDDYRKVLAAKIVSRNPEHPYRLIVVADTDFLHENFWSRPLLLGDKNYFIPVTDNADFVLNALESLSDENSLLGLRGKEPHSRRFIDIENIRKLGIQKYSLKEDEILKQINHIKDGLQEITAKKNFEGRDNFTSDELAIIAGIRKELTRLKTDLQTIKSQTGQDIRDLDLRVKFFNIYLVPLLLTLIVTFLALRKKRLNEKCLTTISLSLFSRRFLWILSAAAFLLLALGIISVYMAENRSQEPMQGELLFPRLAQKINQVKIIRLSGNGRQINLIKKDNEWQLEKSPAFPVYQDRVRSFLTALLHARYEERKSAQIENLPHFDLGTNPDSPAVLVELAAEDGKELAALNIGRYDLDLGRGAKGAYIRFDNRFQVWLVNADFIDLSLKPSDWSFHTAWNLRLGRLISANGDTDPDLLANLARDLLNTSLSDAVEQLTDAEKLFAIDLKVEDNIQIKLQFWKKGTKYYLQYLFANNSQSSAMQRFQKSAEKYYYQLSSSALEKLKNAAKN